MIGRLRADARRRVQPVPSGLPAPPPRAEPPRAKQKAKARAKAPEAAGGAKPKSKARGGGRAAAAPPPEATRLPPTTWTHPLADLSDGLKRQNDEFLAEMKAAAQLGLPPAL